MLTAINTIGVILAASWFLIAIVLFVALRARPKVFLSYRRADTRDMTDRLYEDLSRVLGKDHVFKDDREIPLGEPWPDEIEHRLTYSDVVLVMIGEQWLTLTDSTGERRRIDLSEDWVRLEVEKALRLNKKILNVLVNQTGFPQGQVPQSIDKLPRLQATTLNQGNNYKYDVRRIITFVKEKSPQSPLRIMVWTLYSVGLLQFIGFTLLLLMSWFSLSDVKTRLASIETRKVLPYSFQEVADMVWQNPNVAAELSGSEVIWSGKVTEAGENFIKIIPTADTKEKNPSRCDAYLYSDDKAKIKQAKEAEEVMVFGRVKHVIAGEESPPRFIFYDWTAFRKSMNK